MSDEQTDMQWLNTKLSPEQAAEFEAIQDFYGLNTRSDVVRLLIRQEARRIAAAARPLTADVQAMRA